MESTIPHCWRSSGELVSEHRPSESAKTQAAEIFLPVLTHPSAHAAAGRGATASQAFGWSPG